MPIWLPGLILSAFLYQNCGGFLANKSANIYSYQTAPTFFYDVQLAKVTVDSALRQSYQFDIAISYAQNPDSPLTYQMNFSTEKLNPVCPRSEGTLQADGKHFTVNCLIPTEDSLQVELIMVGPNNETVTDRFRF